jgi:5-methylphenazine-1-carboxylate 1-monooxygenase
VALPVLPCWSTPRGRQAAHFPGQPVVRLSPGRLAAFDAWRFPWLDLHGLIEQSPGIYEFPLVDRDPVSAWSFGRVTLIGDAAHPMQPIGGQSGSQAIVDARVLTAALIATSNPTEAQTHDASQRC